MKNNKKADTIAGIIIAVFILSFAMLGIVNVLDYNQNISQNYEKETDSYILKSNSENILKRLNVDNIQENGKFYIYKNTASGEFLIMTGAANEKYKYVDKDGNNVDPNVYIGKTFTREFVKKIDILRYDIKPPEINNLIFHFDANNINGNGNIGINDGDTISVWKDLATANGEQNAVNKSTLPDPTNYSSNLPTYSENGLNLLPMVQFNGIDQMLAMDLNTDINNDGDDKSQAYFMEKSFAIVFRTGEDITSRQMVYEQGGAATGYNFMIENGDVWAGIHNIACRYNFNGCTLNYADTKFSDTDPNFYWEWDYGNKFKSVNLGEVRPNTVYFVMIVQDSTHINRTHANIIDDIKENLTTHNKYIDSQNRLKIYLNGVLANETDHVDPQPEHSYGALGNIYRWNVSAVTKTAIDDVNFSDKVYFKGGIGELISRNHALTENEIKGVQNYFSQKWLGGKKSIRYDIIETNIKEFKDF
ncbi:MAG: hypothetical protein PHV23_01250 [Candidatus Gracilibacteria bacterium]|nr:hypothetical protein [Candidatus Gracilibacteria bacterium]